MNSLEFIEKEIERCKNIKNGIIAILKEPYHEESFKLVLIDDLRNYENALSFLNQVKIELEGWEAIKSELVIEKHVANSYEDEYRTITFKSGCIDDIEILENKSKINAISKALEVKND